MGKINLSELTAEGSATGAGVADQEIANLTANDPNVKRAMEEKREIADFSDLPAKDPGPMDDVPTYKDAAEQLVESGEFDEYLNKLTEERAKVDEAIREHNEQVAAVLGEEVPDVITDEDVDRSQQQFEDLGMTTEHIDELLNPSLAADDDEYKDPVEYELESEYPEEEDDEEEEESLTAKDLVDEEKNSVEKRIEEGNVGENVSFDIDEDDIKDLYEEEDEVDTDDSDDNLKELQQEITERLKPVSSKLDLSTFTIVNKPATVNSVIGKEEQPEVDWVLFNSKCHYGMTRFSGTEINKLGDGEGNNAYRKAYNRYALILKHMTGPNKPKDVKEFTKSVAFSDNDDLYAGIYIGAFADANFIPYDCTNRRCKHTFMSDNIDINSMYSFENEEQEREFNAIRNQQKYEFSPLYVSAAIPLTEKIAVSFRDPSIYSVIFEPTLLDTKFTEKYNDIITLLTYIDCFYKIDAATHTISPIETKVFKNNEAKTLKARIVEYAKILNSLSSDDYNIITACIAELTKKSKRVKWTLPEMTCPKCGTRIKAREMDAQTLLFTRHQLAALATITLD